MTDPVKIHLQPLGQTIEVERGTELRTVLHAFGVEFPCGGRGRCNGCRVKRISGSLAVTDSQRDILTPEEIRAGWRLACRSVAESEVTLEIGQWETVILADHSPFEFVPRPGLGIAVDLGTTTLVAQLVDLESGRVLAVRTELNPQSIHGGDVMSRIHLAVQGGRAATLEGEIRRGIGSLLSALVTSVALEERRLETVVIAGNTVMHHLFCGIDLEPLSRSPFETVEGGLKKFSAGELGWQLDGDPMVKFLPCLGSFVGSDALCGVVATRMHQSDVAIVLVDLGTNGEIVVGDRERIMCTSAAAGPAFEGGRISMGMRATTGAISEVSVDRGRLRCRVLGDVVPRGICGSGLVDAIAAGLDLGLIQPSGRLTDPGRPLELAPPAILTQADIRELQLAKAAISAAIRILRRRFGNERCAKAPVYLAGAFGNYINRASARRIGLIDAPIEQIHPAGNTALLGAKMALFANDAGEDFLQLPSRVQHVSLAADPDFQRIFIREVSFAG